MGFEFEAKKLYDELDVVNLECKMLGAGTSYSKTCPVEDWMVLRSEAQILKEAVVVAQFQALGQVSQCVASIPLRLH